MTIIKHEPWECPRCKTINAPWVAQCTCKPEEQYDDNKKCYSTKTETGCEAGLGHNWTCISVSTVGDTYVCTKCGKIRQYLPNGDIVDL